MIIELRFFQKNGIFQKNKLIFGKRVLFYRGREKQKRATNKKENIMS